jgi:hypothetical protein
VRAKEYRTGRLEKDLACLAVRSCLGVKLSAGAGWWVVVTSALGSWFAFAFLLPFAIRACVFAAAAVYFIFFAFCFLSYAGGVVRWCGAWFSALFFI